MERKDGNLHCSGWCDDNVPKDKRKYSFYIREGWKWALVSARPNHVGIFCTPKNMKLKEVTQ